MSIASTNSENQKQEQAASLNSEIQEAPRYSCGLGGALGSTLALFGGVPILHAGAGCGLGQQFGLTYAGGQNAAGGQGTTNTPCSCLVEEQVVYGGEDKLRKLISSSLKVMVGDFFAVISGCVPSLIGDDVDSVVAEFRTQAPIVHVKAPGFAGNSYDGYEAFLGAIADQLLEPKPIVNNRINIFGIVPFQHLFWKGDLAVLKQLFAKLGIEANIIFTEFSGLENLRKIPSAKLNLVLSPWNGHQVAEKLRAKFDTPFITFPGVPIGPKETTRLLRKVADALAIRPGNLEKVIQEEERHSYRFAEYFGDTIMMGVPNAFYAIVADSGTAINLAKYLSNEVAYLPDIVIITDNPPDHARPAIVQELIAGLNITTKPEIVFDSDAHRIRQKLKGRSFLFLLASSLEKHISHEYGAVHHSVGFPSYDRLIVDRSYAGYRGGLVLMEDLLSKVAGPL